MISGYMGRVLWVDLSNGKLWEDSFPEKWLHQYVGGYGVGARLFFDKIKPGIDPLGEDNLLAFITGPLTGSPAPTGTRWAVTTKSPLTGGWGDANGSGAFGVALRSAGFDAVVFSGISPRPVYLYLNEGQAELRDASALWGMDCYEVDDWCKATLGSDVESACIGPAGERHALIAGIIHAKGRAAARSGVGAVMGSKRLKMVAARGSLELPLADPDACRDLRSKYMKEILGGVGASNLYRKTGTPGVLAPCIVLGDTPLYNWGASNRHFPDPTPLDFAELLKLRTKRRACWKCPIGCWGMVKVNYQGKEVESHQPEYESGAGFSALAGSNDYPAAINANDICNRYGLDTISAGGCTAFAIECYQHGIITSKDTGGLELAWGDHVVMNRLLEMIARGEHIGALLAQGVKRAAEALGSDAEEFAIHVGGQELPFHDPRFEPGLGLIYKVDATPGRHTQGTQFTAPPGYKTDRPGYGEKRNDPGRGKYGKESICLNHTMSASGACLFGYGSTHVPFIPEFLTAVTGVSFSVEDMLLAGERIAAIRQAFNTREGINPVTLPIPGRAYGLPPLPDGPTAGVTVEIDQMMHDHLENMGWTLDAAIPTRATLERLGMSEIAGALWKE
jgi:aldehyde:ferredoxin oxidoreductase